MTRYFFTTGIYTIVLFVVHRWLGFYFPAFPTLWYMLIGFLFGCVFTITELVIPIVKGKRQ